MYVGMECFYVDIEYICYGWVFVRGVVCIIWLFVFNLIIIIEFLILEVIVCVECVCVVFFWLLLCKKFLLIVDVLC